MLNLELSSIRWRLPERDAPEVLLGCEGSEMHIRVRSAALQNELARTIPIPRTESGRDRVVALAISELFVASWVEALLAASAKRIAAAAGPAPSPPSPSPPPERKPSELELGARAFARVRDIAEPLSTLQPTLVPQLVVDHVRVFLAGGVELGEASRTRGDAVVTNYVVGGGIGYRSGRRGNFAFEADLSGALLATHLHVRATSTNVAARDADGIGGEIVGRAGPVLVLDPWRFALGLAGGTTFPSLEGRVASEAPVRLHGPWLGLDLTVAAKVIER